MVINGRCACVSCSEEIEFIRIVSYLIFKTVMEACVGTKASTLDQLRVIDDMQTLRISRVNADMAVNLAQVKEGDPSSPNAMLAISNSKNITVYSQQAKESVTISSMEQRVILSDKEVVSNTGDCIEDKSALSIPNSDDQDTIKDNGGTSVSEISFTVCYDIGSLGASAVKFQAIVLLPASFRTLQLSHWSEVISTQEQQHKFCSILLDMDGNVMIYLGNWCDQYGLVVVVFNYKCLSILLYNMDVTPDWVTKQRYQAMAMCSLTLPGVWISLTKQCVLHEAVSHYAILYRHTLWDVPFTAGVEFFCVHYHSFYSWDGDQLEYLQDHILKHLFKKHSECYNIYCAL